MREKRISKSNIEDMMNLTTLQEGMLYHYVYNRKTNKYRIQICIEFSEVLDYQKVKSAWDYVAGKNQMLRTVFRWENISRPVQIVLKEYSISVRYYDVTYMGQPQEAFEEIKRNERHEEIDLEVEAFRVSVCKVSTTKSIMILNYHHIILDGWSLGIILEEFIQRYLGKSIEKKKMKYSEYVAYIRRKDNIEDTEFWKRYLQGIKTQCGLYGDKAYILGEEGKIRKFKVNISSQYIERSHTLSKTYGVTFASLIYFVWSYQLSKYTKSNDIVFGTSVSGRECYFEGIENTVGEYANTIPFHYGFQTDKDSCIKIIKDIHNNIIQRNQYAHTQMDQINNACHLGDLSPLYNTIVVIDNYPINNLSIYQGSYIKIDDVYELNDFDITLQVFFHDCIEIVLYYNENYFSQEWVRSFCSCFVQAFCWTVDHPMDPIGSIQMLNDKEIKKLVLDFGQCKVDYPYHETIIDIFERKVKTQAKNTALIFRNETMTYEELNRKATNVSRYLMFKLGVQEGDIVGIMAGRSFEMIIGIFAILKCGAAYLPISTDYPMDRVNYIIEDSKINILLVTSDCIKVDSKIHCVNICNIEQDEAGQMKRRIWQDNSNAAYVLYTSGTTGSPKGVIVSNGNLINMLYVLYDRYKIEQGEALLLKTVYTFDISVTEIFGWVIGEGKLVISEDGDEKDVDVLIRLIDKYSVKKINFVPSAFWALLTVLNEEQCHIIDRMSYIFLCGEAIPIELVNMFVDKIYGPRLENLYGPTETTVFATAMEVELRKYSIKESILIGKPLPNYGVLVLDSANRVLPENIEGELCIYGKGLSLGYINNEKITEEKYIYLDWLGKKVYKTGDLGYWNSQGNLVYKGRIDNQVKLRGYRIELSEVESTLLKHEHIEKAAVLVGGNEQDILCAYIVSNVKINNKQLSDFCSKWLPEYMIPTEYIYCEDLVYTNNGKLDKKALSCQVAKRGYIKNKKGEIVKPLKTRPYMKVKEEIKSVWSKVLHKEISTEKTFFENGGSSLSILKVYRELEKKYTLKITDLFKYQTISSLAGFLCQEENDFSNTKQMEHFNKNKDIAIIGIAGKYPLAENINMFWENLCNGVEAVRHLTDEEFERIKDKNKYNKNYVRYTVPFEDCDCFDSSFFNYSARESEMIDPQQRIFLECAYHALEDAGISPRKYSGQIGVFASCSMSSYLYNQANIQSKDDFSWMLANDKDYINTRVSYKLGLTGPSMNIQTACSSSLVAVHMACRCLQNGDADVMVVGGASLRIPNDEGYLYREGGILSKDGHCRAFDINASGTVSGGGVGVIVLTSLEHAIQEHYQIYAVIKASEVNNDGNSKVAFTAPSVQGQAEVIAKCLKHSGIEANQIGYIETHGTGTKLGDSIEIASLNEAYSGRGKDKPDIAIGSVKSNIGHLDSAAGITGLIKAALCLKYKKLVPSINFSVPNPELNLQDSVFYVNTEYKDWQCRYDARRAAVSSFGIGGTNAHVILEEYKEFDYENDINKSESYVIFISAKTEGALDNISKDIGKYIARYPGRISNIQYTLAVGRNDYDYRCAIIATKLNDLYQCEQIRGSCVGKSERKLVFMFPGQGCQYTDMGLVLYKSSEVFRDTMNKINAMFERSLFINYIDILYDQQRSTVDMQPAIFMCEYSLAKFLMSIGIQPHVVVGHSLGEYAAACVSGIFSLEDAVYIISERCRLIQATKKGCMAVVNTSVNDSRIHLGKASIACINSETLFVVSGDQETISKIESECKTERIYFQYIESDWAYHSYMLDRICDEFRKVVSSVQLNKATISIVSCISGDWMEEEYMNPKYWVSHLRDTVKFDDSLNTICKNDDYLYLEVGPGQILSSYARKKKRIGPQNIFSTLIERNKDIGIKVYDKLVGELYCSGAVLNYEQMFKGKAVQKISLPLYPFEKKRFWSIGTKENIQTDKKEEGKECYYPKPDLDNKFVMPVSSGEKLVTSIFEDKLGVEKIGMIDDFFALGGHSLIAVQIITEINMIFQTEFSLVQILMNPTVQGVMNELIHALGGEEVVEKVAEMYAKRRR